MAKLKTRNQILQAAEKLFAENGFNGVPTKLIAKEAGITEMTLFNHFKNKKLLYKTIVKERYLSLEIKSVFCDLSYENLNDDLKIVSNKMITNFIENKTLLMMRLKEKQSFQGDKVFTIEEDPLLKQLEPLFNTFQKKALIKNSGEQAAKLFMIMFKGICHISMLDNQELAYVTDTINDFVDVFCDGIKK